MFISDMLLALVLAACVCVCTSNQLCECVGYTNSLFTPPFPFKLVRSYRDDYFLLSRPDLRGVMGAVKDSVSRPVQTQGTQEYGGGGQHQGSSLDGGNNRFSNTLNHWVDEPHSPWTCRSS